MAARAPTASNYTTPELEKLYKCLSNDILNKYLDQLEELNVDLLVMNECPDARGAIKNIRGLRAGREMVAKEIERRFAEALTLKKINEEKGT